VGEPGAQGAGMEGTQGCGVSTPIAAEVAEATAGFDMEVHIPNGGILTMGLLSIIVARGCDVIVLFSGVTTNDAGAVPNGHCILAPPQTQRPIIY